MGTNENIIGNIVGDQPIIGRPRCFLGLHWMFQIALILGPSLLVALIIPTCGACGQEEAESLVCRCCSCNVNMWSLWEQVKGPSCRCCCTRNNIDLRYGMLKFVVMNDMQLVSNPALFDMLVMPNLYSHIICDFCACLIGGLDLTQSGNIGDNGLAHMEVVHMTAPEIVGKNMPNSIVLSAVMMFPHLIMTKPADKIHKAILKTIVDGKYQTFDLEGPTCSDYTKTVIGNL